MINYTWNCKVVDAYPQDGEYADVVYNVHWNLLAVSDQLNPEGVAYASSNIGTQILNVSDITDFIPFEDLTNEESVAWTQTAMGEEQVASIEANIAQAIELLITPTSITATIGEPIPLDGE